MSPSIQLMNYLRTLQIAPSSCIGFEEEALGACIGLVGWGYPSGTAARRALYEALQAAAFNTKGTLSAGPDNKSFFYSALLHRQMSAFGPFGFDDVNWSHFDLAAYPWALPEPLFDHLYLDVMADRGPTYERPPTWNDVVKVGEALGLMTPAGAFGKKLLKSFLTKYMPELMEGAIAEWAVPTAGAVAFAGIVFEAWASRVHNQQTKEAFRIDKDRRDFDHATSDAIVSR